MNAFSIRIKLFMKFSKAALLPMPDFQIEVKNNQDTLDYIISNNSSVVRFGDGEAFIMCGKSIDYQDYSEELATKLRKIIDLPSSEKLVVCIPDVFHNLNRFRLAVEMWWKDHLHNYRDFYLSLNNDHWYGSAFISRPYMDWKKTPQIRRGDDFEKLKRLWNEEDILIVEGSQSRSGVGNDLFDGAKSIHRIICPPQNAFSEYETIKSCIRENAQGKLVLIMLGPTAKVLAYELAMEGFRAIDLGHIDSEYEWCKMGVTKKVKLKNKHTAEWNKSEDIPEVTDEEYSSQIICDLTQ